MEGLTAARPSLVVCPHPLLAAAGRELYYAEFMPGESIAEYLERAGVKLGRQPWMLAVNGQPLPQAWWGRVRPKPGTIITLRALVHKGGGGGGGGKNPLQTVLSIALMVAAPGIGNAIAGAFGLSGTAFSVFGTAISWGQIFAGAVSIAGSLVIGSLTQPPQPQLSQVNGTYNAEQVSPTYALSGGSNRARPFEPLPLVLGRHRMFPDAGAKDFTEFEGDDQYYYQIFNFGIGTPADLLLTDFKIGSTPVSSYTDVEIFEAAADGKLPQMPGNVDSTAGGAMTAAAGWITRTSGANATALSVDIQGQLYRAGASGLESLSCQIEAEYRLVGAGGWTAWFAETLTSSSRKPIRRTWRFNVAQGQYEVRVRRVTADETDARNISDFAWNVLKTYQPDTADYTGQRRVGVRIKASGQLQGRLAEFNAIAQRKVPVWHAETSSWVTEATGNPAWLYLWFARGGLIAGRPAFGVCLADGRIDIEGLKAWGAFCTAKSLSFNVVFDSQRSRADMLNTIARCGRASPSWATGKLGVVWDAPDQPVVAVFGMGNIVAGSFRVQYTNEKLADEIVLRFINPDDDWKQDQVRVKVPGYPVDYVPQRPVVVELFGCTDKDMAGRECNLIAASQRYHRRRVLWQSDFEGLVAQRGDVVQLSHDLTKWGSSGRLVGATDATVTLDRKVTYSSGSPYIGVRHPDGTWYLRAIQAFSGESDTLTLLAPLTFTEGDPPATYNCATDPSAHVIDYTYVFDIQATPGKRVKVVGVPKARNAGARIEFTATDDDPDYYASEANPYMWVARSASVALPSISNLDVIEQLVPTGAGYANLLHVTWDVAGDFDKAVVMVSENGGAMRTAGEVVAGIRYDLMAPDTGTVTVRVVLVDGAGRSDPTNGAAEIVHLIAGKLAKPVAVSGFAAQQQGNVVVLACDEPTEEDVLFAEVRLCDLGDLEWNNGIPQANIPRGRTITSAAIPPGTWTLHARYRDTSENYSETSATLDIAVSADGYTTIRHAEAAPDWPGTLTNFVRHWTGVLVPNGTKTCDQYGWEVFDQFVPDPAAICTYEAAEIDKGIDVPARIWGDIVSVLGPGETVGIANPKSQVDYRLAAGSYDGFEDWTIGTVPFRYVKGKIVLDTRIGVAKITGFALNVDRQPVTEEKRGIAVAAGGTAITFDNAFHSPPMIVAHNDGATPLLPTHGSDSATGTTLHLSNTAAPPVDVGGTGGYTAFGA